MTASKAHLNLPIKKFQIKCPTCGQSTLYSLDNPHRPFCSPRCQKSDQASWADETYKIKGKNLNDPDHFA